MQMRINAEQHSLHSAWFIGAVESTVGIAANIFETKETCDRHQTKWKAKSEMRKANMYLVFPMRARTHTQAIWV